MVLEFPNLYEEFSPNQCYINMCSFSSTSVYFIFMSQW